MKKVFIVIAVILLSGVVFADEVEVKDYDEYELGYIDGYTDYLMGEWEKFINKSYAKNIMYDEGYLDGSIHATLGQTSKYIDNIDFNTGIFVSKWRKQFYVDEFGDYTVHPFVTNRTKIIGNFTNAYVHKGKLSVQIIVDSSGMDFSLYEYDSNLVYGRHDRSYEMQIKDQEGEIHTFYPSYPRYGTRMWCEDEDEAQLLNELFMTDQILKVIISEKYPTSYSFNIDTTGFKDWYELVFPDSAQNPAQSL